MPLDTHTFVCLPLSLLRVVSYVSVDFDITSILIDLLCLCKCCVLLYWFRGAVWWCLHYIITSKIKLYLWWNTHSFTFRSKSSDINLVYQKNGCVKNGDVLSVFWLCWKTFGWIIDCHLRLSLTVSVTPCVKMCLACRIMYFLTLSELYIDIYIAWFNYFYDFNMKSFF